MMPIYPPWETGGEEMMYTTWGQVKTEAEQMAGRAAAIFDQVRVRPVGYYMGDAAKAPLFLQVIYVVPSGERQVEVMVQIDKPVWTGQSVRVDEYQKLHEQFMRQVEAVIYGAVFELKVEALALYDTGIGDAYVTPHRVYAKHRRASESGSDPK